MDIYVTHEIKWGGSVWLADIKKAATLGVKEAVTIYFWEIHRMLNLHWGSEQYRGNARKTIEHSPPGSPPFIQTQNLANSLNVAYGARAARVNGGAIIAETGPITSLQDQIVGCVYTDVPYAKELEYGGLAGPYKASQLKYTSWILINPIRHMMYIAARPAWRPAYQLSVSRMINAITYRMRTMMKRSYI